MLYEGLNSKQITAKSARYTAAAARFEIIIVPRCSTFATCAKGAAILACNGRIDDSFTPGFLDAGQIM